MDESRYTPAPLPPKADVNMSLDDIRALSSETADIITAIRAQGRGPEREGHPSRRSGDLRR